ncbi:hypothetical protein WR25_17309 isoform A [Diploscapter pachys]|uniref:K Homology domain-containing protein n=1 Tax=Diploscapter pachys TaxID=2018661 RepID=A0A2A2L6K6_9BILA|nr:hypothetical protein WR25_17309 isoform A [Diploscapter pachys]
MDPLLSGSYVQYGIGPSSASLPSVFENGNPHNHQNDHVADPSSSSSPRNSPNINLILTIRLLMQGKEVGSIIGKRGEQIKKIREESGAKINISDGSCPERIVTITGTLNVINKAFAMVCNKFEEDLLQLPNSVPKPPITLRLIVPATQCGSLIGKQGSKIKEIREATGASIQVASEMLPQSTERAVTISGTADAINLCMREVCQILLEAPPKGATLSYRPKPTFNPLLIASSAAAIANAQAQQLTTAALLQNIPQGAAAAFLPQQFPGVIPAGELSRGLPPGFGSPLPSLPSTAYLPAASAAQLNPHQEFLLGGGLVFANAAPHDPTKLLDPWVMQANEKQQLDLINQYATINSSMLMGAPLLKNTSPPTTSAASAGVAGQTPGGQAAASAYNPKSNRFNPY